MMASRPSLTLTTRSNSPTRGLGSASPFSSRRGMVKRRVDRTAKHQGGTRALLGQAVDVAEPILERADLREGGDGTERVMDHSLAFVGRRARGIQKSWCHHTCLRMKAPPPVVSGAV